MDEALYDAHFGREGNDDGDGISMTPTGSSRGGTNEDQQYVRKPPSRKVMIAQTVVHFLYTIFNIYIFIILWYLIVCSYREVRMSDRETMLDNREEFVINVTSQAIFSVTSVTKKNVNNYRTRGNCSTSENG